MEDVDVEQDPVLKVLREVELVVFNARAALVRAEQCGCQAVGCTPGDGSKLADAVFNMVYNTLDIGRVHTLYRHVKLTSTNIDLPNINRGQC